MAEFFNEIRRIRDEPVPLGELEESKRSIVASFALSLEQPSRALGFAITRKLYGLPADYWDGYASQDRRGDGADVQRVARKYLESRQACRSGAVGDAGKIKAVLEKYGAVEVYDSNGALVPPAAFSPPASSVSLFAALSNCRI